MPPKYSKKETQKQNRTVRNLPVANERLYKETAWLTNSSPKQVEEIINSVSLFVHNTIKSGTFNTVQIPNFGKFKIKPSRVQRIEVINRIKNETIRGGRKQRGKTEHAVDQTNPTV
jgi:nucleoid DNA-binding protein